MGRKPDTLTGGLQEGSGLGEIGENRTGCRILTGSASVEKSITHHVPTNSHGIEDAINRSKNMGLWNERRNNADFDFIRLVGFDRGDQFDAVAELVCKTDVSGGHFFNSFDEDVVRIHPKTISQRSENNRLVGGVPTVDVQSGIRLRIAEFLGFGEHWREIQTLIGHAGEDVVARAIENAMNRFKAVSDEGLANGFDDRDSSGDSCLARRDVSNSALQALTLMNDPMFVEVARALGAAALSGPGDDAARLDDLGRRVLSRPFAAGEREALLGFLRVQRERLAAGELDATKLGGEGGGDPVDRAAWMLVARAVMNLDETVVKR